VLKVNSSVEAQLAAAMFFRSRDFDRLITG